jgi:hypothetical protein
MRLLGNVFLFAAWAAFLVFPVLYHWRSAGSWRHHTMGRHLFFFMVGVLIVLTFAVCNLLWGPLPDWVRPLCFGITAGIGWWRVLLLWLGVEPPQHEPAEAAAAARREMTPEPD